MAVRCAGCTESLEGVLALRHEQADAETQLDDLMALSKGMITLGLEPENMPTTLLPTPGVPSRP